jgi:hypothetical protein
MADGFVHALDRRRQLSLQFESAPDEGLYRFRYRDGARFGETAHPSRQIRRETVDVVLCGVQVHNSAMNAHPDIDVEAEALPNPCAQGGNLAGDVQAGLHRPLHVVLMGLWMSEESQQSVTLGRTDVALVLADDAHDVVAVAPNDRSVGLRFDPGRQCGGVDKVGEQDRQAADFAVLIRRGQKVFSVGVVAVDGEYLTGEEVGCCPITFCGGAQCAIEQLIDAGRSIRLTHSANETSMGSPSC